jgi:hypothetical protein
MGCNDLNRDDRQAGVKLKGTMTRCQIKFIALRGLNRKKSYCGRLRSLPPSFSHEKVLTVPQGGRFRAFSRCGLGARLLARSSLRFSFCSILFSLVLLSGCAHYYLPASQLETPESVGPERIGRIELLGIQSGTDLIATPQQQAPDPVTGTKPDPALETAPVNYVFGAWVAINPKLDLGIRFAPEAPVLARAKYQLYGEPESTARAGNWSASVSGSGGALLSTYNGSGVTFYEAIGSLIGGWRFGDHHVASLAPFFCYSGLSGVGIASGSGSRFRASLGYQYDVESLLLRAELTWASGSFAQQTGSANAGGIFPGAVLGLKL